MILKVKNCPNVQQGIEHEGHPWLRDAEVGENSHWYDCAGLRAAPEPEEVRPARPASKPATGRDRALDEARRLVVGDRDVQYGSPRDNFARAADVLNGLGYSGPGGRRLAPADVAVINIGLKMARASQGHKLDTVHDVIGYGACWAEVIEETS